jgi:ribosomal protein S8
MSNAIQLDLFQGVLLTTKQQKEVDGFVERQEKYAVNAQKRTNEIMLMLDRAGFVQGVDYDSNFEVHEVTHEREFGYSYDNSNYMHEVTYMNSVGNVYLKVNRIESGVVIQYNSSVSKEGDKLMCTSVTSQYRYYKPSSLLTKYKLHNERVICELEHKNKESIALDTIVKKYQTLYPEATVTIDSDFYRHRGNYTDFPIVKVLFKSGSWVTFQLGYSSEMDKERFHKKSDAQFETTKDLLDRFNNQKAK